MACCLDFEMFLWMTLRIKSVRRLLGMTLRAQELRIFQLVMKVTSSKGQFV